MIMTNDMCLDLGLPQFEFRSPFLATKCVKSNHCTKVCSLIGNNLMQKILHRSYEINVGSVTDTEQLLKSKPQIGAIQNLLVIDTKVSKRSIDSLSIDCN